MPNSRHFPRRWARFPVAALVLVSMLSCVDGGLFGTGSAVSIGFAPNFQILESDFGAGPIDRIRATAYEAETSTVVGTFDEEVDPLADAWDVALPIDLGERTSLSVIVELELFSDGVVVWSARAGPLVATSGSSAAAQEVTVFRGPLGNLDVTGVTILDAPTQLLQGETGTAMVQVDVASGSTETPTAFWASLDPTVATVVEVDGEVVITAVAAGTTSIVVAAGPESDEVEVEVLPRVQSVVVTPATSIVSAIGVQLPYEAVVTDGFGQVTTSETVVWSTADGSVASVDANGLVTTTGFGTTEVRATAGGVTGVATVTVDGVVGFDLVWLGSLSDDWIVPGNWNTGVVPTALDNVLIPAVTTLPRLTGAAAVTDLTVESEASLTLADQSGLVVSGNLTVEPFAAIEAEGDALIQMTGVDVTIQGEINPTLSVSGSVSLAANVITEGTVSVTGTGARLNIADSQMLVSGSFLTGVEGVFEMTGSASSALVVDGDISLTGGSTEGLLTSGVIRVRGDFIAGGPVTTVFAPTGSHSVIFEGTASQAIGFGSPAADESRFAIVWFNSQGTTTVNTDLVATTELWLFQNAVDMGSSNLFVGGRLRDVVGGLNYGELHLISDVSDVPTSLPGPVHIDGTVVWPESSTIDGDLVVDNSLDIVDFELTVNGDVSVNGGLSIGEPATISALGTLFLSGGSVLDVEGELSALDCVNDGGLITGLGLHPCALGLLRTWIGGSDLDPTSWFVASNWSPSGVPTLEDDVLIPLTSFNPVTAATSFEVRDLTVDVEATLDLGGNEHVAYGDVLVDGFLVNGGLTLEGGEAGVVSGSFSGLDIATDRSLGGDVEVDGDLFVLASTLSIGAEALYVAGDLSLEPDAGTAAIRMDDADGQVQVDGEFGVRGASLDGLLTAGTLRLAGDLFGSGSRFVATGSHLTEFNGSGLQEVGIGTSGAAEARFFDVVVQEGSTVSFLTDTHISNDLTVTGELLVEAAATIEVAGTLILQAGAVLDLDGDLTAVGGCINLGATILGIGLHPCGDGFDFTWLGGDAADATSWENVNNWLPNGVPDVTASVLVPLADDAPVLAADASVGSLQVEAGMTLDLGGFDLEVVSSLQSLGTISNGLVTLSGAGVELEGSVDDLEIAANRLLTGPLIATGDVTLNDADLDIGAETATIGGALQLNGLNAQLRMLDAAGLLQVAGDATFDGGSHVGQLLEGTLTIGGNFAATGAGNNAFTAQNNHTVVFDGSALQEVAFTLPGSSLQRFANVRLEGSGGAFFSTDVFVMGAIEVVSGTTVDASDATVSIAGAYVDPDNGMLLNQLSVIGDLTALPTTLTTQMVVNATLNLPGDLALIGSITLNNADLSIGTNALDVSGDLLVTGSSAQLAMLEATSDVDILGNATFDGGSHVGQLTDGVLRIGGDFTTTASNANAFVAQSGHTTVFNGSTVQTVSFSNPGTVTERFANMQVTNFMGATTFATDIVVSGEFQSDAESAIAGSSMSVAGAYLPGSGATSLTDVVVYGDLTAITPSLTTNVTVTSTFNLPGPLSVTGDVTIDGGRLAVGANDLDVSGNLLVTGTGAQLAMLDAASDVDILGSATFDGGSHVGQLTNGVLRIGGDFTTTAANANAFVAQTAHTTVLNGSGLQTVVFSNPGTATERFFNLAVLNANGSTDFATDFVVEGDFSSDADASASGALILVAGAYLPGGGTQIDEVVVYDDLTAITPFLTANVTVLSTLNLPGPLSVTGNVTVDGGRLAVGANDLDVSGDLLVTGAAGQLAMLDAASDVDILGSATFDGGSHVGQLTNGVLRIGGDFTTTAANANAFVAQTAHTTVLNGSGLQSVVFSNPGTATERFFNLAVVNVNGSTDFATDFVVEGDFSSDADASASGALILVAGAYLPGGGTQIDEVVVYDDLTAITPFLTANVTVLSTLNLPGSLSVTGDVTIDGGRLAVGANDLDVSGNLLVTGAGAQLAMLDAASDVDILGSATFDGGSHVGQLTNGVLRIGGDFTTTTSNTNAFVAQTAHTTVLNGNGLQTVLFSNPGTATERFFNLAVLNVNGSTDFATDFVVGGEYSSEADASVSGGVVYVAGAYLPGGGGDVAEVVVYDDLTDITPFLTANVTVTSTFNLPGSLSVSGNVTVDGGRLAVGANDLDVTGDLLVTGAGAQLAMLDAASDVDILGSATFDGGSHVGQLANGVLRIGGDFSATASDVNAFVAQTLHATVLNGTAAQTVSFASPSVAQQRFENLELANFSGGITFLSDAVAFGDFTVFAGVNVDASDDVLSVGGSYEDGSDGISIQELVVVGNLSSHSGGLNGDLTVDADWSLTDAFYVAGDVVVNDSRLVLNGNVLVTDGNFDVTGSGQLVMTNSLDDLTIVGNATFAGGSHVNQLTEGTISLVGDLTASGSASAFVGQSNHTVDFVGTALQTVTFDQPGVTAQRFANLTLTYPAQVGMATTAVATGTFQADDVGTSVIRSGAVGTVLDLRGTAEIYEMTVDGMPIRLESAVAPGSHIIDNIEFTNMDPTETQLYLELPGASVTFASLTASGLIFDEVLTTGKYVETASNNGLSWTLQMDSPSPGSVSLADIIIGLLSPIIWPWP